MKPNPSPADHCFEDVEVRGHIIDSLILPRILEQHLTGWRFIQHQGDPHRT